MPQLKCTVSERANAVRRRTRVKTVAGASFAACGPDTAAEQRSAVVVVALATEWFADLRRRERVTLCHPYYSLSYPTTRQPFRRA